MVDVELVALEVLLLREGLAALGAHVVLDVPVNRLDVLLEGVGLLERRAALLARVVPLVGVHALLVSGWLLSVVVMVHSSCFDTRPHLKPQHFLLGKLINAGGRSPEHLSEKHETKIRCHYRDVSKFYIVFPSCSWALPLLLVIAQLLA